MTSGNEKSNERVVERLIDCINRRKIEIMDELFHDDAVMEWPQSGERVRGAENRRGIYRAFPQLPTITPRRMKKKLAEVVQKLDRTPRGGKNDAL